MNNAPTMHVVAAGVTALYGLIALVGGIIGYVKANSMASLIAGGVSGIVLLVCAFGITRMPFWSLILALVVALLLVGRFGMVAARSTESMGEFLSSGPGITALTMIIGGVVVILVSILALTTAVPPPGS